MNMYCLIFVCSSLFGSSQVDQNNTSISSSDDTGTKQITLSSAEIAASILQKNDTASVNYSDPEHMELPSLNIKETSVSSSSSTKGESSSTPTKVDSLTQGPSKLSEMLLPPSMRLKPLHHH